MNDLELKKARELADARNLADSLVYTAEKSLVEHKDKIPEDVKQAVTTAVANVKTAKEGSDVAALTSATQTLSTEMQKIGEAVQKAGGGATPPPGPDAPPAGGSETGPVTDV